MRVLIYLTTQLIQESNPQCVRHFFRHCGNIVLAQMQAYFRFSGYAQKFLQDFPDSLRKNTRQDRLAEMTQALFPSNVYA